VPFRIFFAVVAAVVSLQAFAQAGTKPGPMQSGAHTSKPEESAPAQAQPTPAQGQSMDVGALFATSCGWCHSSGGREAGKGPKLMGTTLSDDEIMFRIRNGKVGQMPSFKGAFTDQQMRDIVAYIRGLKPAPK
jgi:mono/diheme cytochrome c family protein